MMNFKLFCDSFMNKKKKKKVNYSYVTFKSNSSLKY